jgi:D-3-phosphoglycerate dehydrogenase
MATVVLTDSTFPSLDVEEAILRPTGSTILTGQCKTAEALIPFVREADVVLTQFAPVTAEVIAAMTRARVIVRYGIGVDNVDLDAARSRKIPVCNVPDYCIDEVADHTLAFILATTRQVVPNCLHLRAGKWGLATPVGDMRTLSEQTVGIVGFGRIGRAVASRLAPFWCRRLAFDPVVEAAAIEGAGCEAISLDVLLAQSDIITLHCPSTAQTRWLLNATSLAKLKRGAIVINLARGDLIETPALIAALESGQVAAAALDVCDPEPIPADSPLRQLPNVILASHIASVSTTAVRRLRETVARIAVTALRGETLPNVVNGVR